MKKLFNKTYVTCAMDFKKLPSLFLLSRYLLRKDGHLGRNEIVNRALITNARVSIMVKINWFFHFAGGTTKSQ
jgi:hypothetical protein